MFDTLEKFEEVHDFGWRVVVQGKLLYVNGMPRWEMSPLRPPFIEVTIEGQVFRGREVKNIQYLYLNWLATQGRRLEPRGEDVVWQAIKDAYPGFIIRYPDPTPTLSITVNAAWSFIEFIRRRMGNKTLVSPLEAQRRANVCLTCPMKSAVMGCGMCKQALKFFVDPPQKLNPRPPEACGACGCWLEGKVWVPREALGSSSAFPFWEGDETHPRCWMHEPQDKIEKVVSL